MKDKITIEQEDHPCLGKIVCVWETGVYPPSSVLAGRPRRLRRKILRVGRDEDYETFNMAIAAAYQDFPEAQIGGGSAFANKMEPPLPKEPPDWFDPANAGEQWSDPDGDFVDDDFMGDGW